MTGLLAVDVWPKRISVSAYRNQAFVSGGAPSVNTIKKNIRSGVTPGEVEGTKYYVWVNQHLKPEMPAGYENKFGSSPTGNELADSLLAGYELQQSA